MNGKDSNKRYSRLILLLLFLVWCTSLTGQEIVCRDSLASASIIGERQERSLSLHRIATQDVKQIITPLGEADVIKYMQRLPGVSAGMEGFSSFSVRGSNMSNNHISLDGVTVYGVTHLFGLTSAISSDIVGSTDVCLGGFSGEDANLLASHVRMKSIDATYKFRAMISVSNLMVSSAITTPVVKDRVSLVFSARISPVQPLYNLVSKKWISPETGLPATIKASASDFYAKATARIDNRNTLALSWLHTDDRYGFAARTETSRDSIGWKNDILLFRWKSYLSPRWTLNVDLSRNQFEAGQMQERALNESVPTTPMAIRSRILEYKASAKVSYAPEPRWVFRGGLDFNSARIEPAVLKASIAEGAETPVFGADPCYTEALFGEVRYEETRIKAFGALRMSLYQGGHGYRVFLPEAHFLVDYSLNRLLTLEVTYDHLAQLYHTLEGLPTGLSTDLIIPSGVYAPPEFADQLYGGLQYRTGSYHLVVGGYWKRMSGLVYYDKADRFFDTSATDWQDHLSLGKGTSYGMELLARREANVLSGQIAYTLSKTNRSFPGVNAGEVFPYKFDRTHILNADLSCRLAKADKGTSHLFHTQFTLTSGHWETLPAGHYGSWYLPQEEELTYFSHPNNYRLPLYIRLDVAYHLSFRSRHVTHDINIGVYNVLNRHNAYSLTWDASSSRWKKLSILPIFPSLRYLVSF